MLMGQGALILFIALALSAVPSSFGIRKAGFEREGKVIGWSEKYGSTHAPFSCIDPFLF